MGDAFRPEKEHILCLLPFPENREILDGIRKKHPNVKFTYLQTTFAPGKPLDLNTLPDGIPHSRYLQLVYDLLTIPQNGGKMSRFSSHSPRSLQIQKQLPISN